MKVAIILSLALNVEIARVLNAPSICFISEFVMGKGGDGATGPTGPTGDPWTAGGMLPSGETETGTWV